MTAANPITEIRNALNELGQRARNLKTAQKEVGQYLVASTKQRFRDQRDPQGRAWHPLAQSTLESRYRRGRGTLILLDTYALFNSIDYQIQGQVVIVSSPLNYAATHQFGRDNIPARPFIGMSPADEVRVLDIYTQHLTRRKRGGFAGLFRRIYQFVIDLF